MQFARWSAGYLRLEPYVCRVPEEHYVDSAREFALLNGEPQHWLRARAYNTRGVVDEAAL